jgi:hypothetical protein
MDLDSVRMGVTMGKGVCCVHMRFLRKRMIRGVVRFLSGWNRKLQIGCWLGRYMIEEDAERFGMPP